MPALGTDALIYHITIPAMWMQSHVLAPLDLVFHDAAAEHSPMLTQLGNYLLMRLTGDDGLVWLVQPAFFLPLLWLFYRSARLAGAGRDISKLAVALMAIHGPFLMSVYIANNELVMLFGAAMLLYGLLLSRRRSARGLIVSAGGLALMLATKHVAVIYAAVALPLLVPVAWRTLKTSRRGVLTCLAAGLLLAIGAGFLWRNWLIYGNPMYPSQVRLGGVTLFDGLYNARPLVDHGWQLANLGYLFFHGNHHFGPRWVLNVPLLLAVVGCVAFAARGCKRMRRWGLLAACVIFPVASALLFLSVVPFWEQHRLLFPVYYAMFLALACLLGRLGRMGPGLRVAAVALPLVMLLCEVFFSSLFVEWWFIAMLAGAVVAAVLPWPTKPLRRFVLPVAGGGLVLLALSGSLWYATYAQNRLAMRRAMYPRVYGTQGQAWNVVNEYTARRPARIAYSGSTLIWPLFGPNALNRVSYVPLSPQDKPTAIKLHSDDEIYERLATARRSTVDEAFWLQRIREHRIELLFLVDDPKVGGVRQELEIVARHPEIFEAIFSQDNVRVFRVKP